MSYQPPSQPYGQPPKPQPFPYPPGPQPSSSKTLLFVILGVAGVAALCVVGILVALLIPAVMAARDAAARMQSMNNLHQIGIALHNYHDTYMAFPAAFVADADGKPRTSWRTSLLAFVEQRPLADQYDFNAAWDDAQNSSVRQTPVPVYQSPRGAEVGTNRTSYVVVTSQKALADQSSQMQTLLPGARWTRIRDV